MAAQIRQLDERTPAWRRRSRRSPAATSRRCCSRARCSRADGAAGRRAHPGRRRRRARRALSGAAPRGPAGRRSSSSPPTRRAPGPVRPGDGVLARPGVARSRATRSPRRISPAPRSHRTRSARRRRARRKRLQWRRFGSGRLPADRGPARAHRALALYTSAPTPLPDRVQHHSMLLLASALGFVALGQLIVMLTGGIDLSVGPLTGLVVVIMSSFAGTGQSAAALFLGVLVVIGAAMRSASRMARSSDRGARAGARHARDVHRAAGRLAAAAPVPGGFYRPGVTSALKTAIGRSPSRSSSSSPSGSCAKRCCAARASGCALRAVGSDATAAHRLGANVTHADRPPTCSARSSRRWAASMLAAGRDRRCLARTQLHAQSITAVVLGGASIFGGRGSFVGALCGAILIQEIVTSTTFLQIGTEWQYYLPGILILAGAGLYSRTRNRQPSALSRRQHQHPTETIGESMADKKIIAVVGATGAQGGGLVRAILERPERRVRRPRADAGPGSPKAPRSSRRWAPRSWPPTSTTRRASSGRSTAPTAPTASRSSGSTSRPRRSWPRPRDGAGREGGGAQARDLVDARGHAQAGCR